MKLLLVFVLLCCATTSHSQAIQFAPLSWRDALAKARAQHKPLFVEMYAPWCTYCRQMERDVFTTKEAGDYYNSHFINVRYDALKSDGIQVRKTYTLPGFPAFLYLDPNGLVLLKTAGLQPPEQFISSADSALQTLANKNR